MIRKNFKKWNLFLLAGLFILSCFFVSPEKLGGNSENIFFRFPFLRYFALDKFLYLTTILILSAYLMETRVLSYLTYPVLRFCKTRKGLMYGLVFVSYIIALFFGTSISLYFTLPLATITLGREEDSPFLFIHCFCLQILAAELGSILLPYTSLSEFYLFLQFKYSLPDYFRISFLFFVFSILFLLPYVFYFRKEENKALSPEIIERLENSYTALKEEDSTSRHLFLLPFCFFSFLLLCSCMQIIPIMPCFILLLLYSLLFRRQVFVRMDYFLFAFIFLIFLIRGNLLTLYTIPELLTEYIQGHEASHSLILSQIFTRLPASIVLADLTTKGRQLIIASILSAIHPLALNYSGVIAYSMLKHREHKKVFILHYLFLHMQMLLLFVFLAFFTGNL